MCSLIEVLSATLAPIIGVTVAYVVPQIVVPGAVKMREFADIFLAKIAGTP